MVIVCLFVFFSEEITAIFFGNLLIFFEVFIFQSALKVKRKNKQTNKTNKTKLQHALHASVEHVEIPQLLINDFITNSKYILDSDWLKEHV